MRKIMLSISCLLLSGVAMTSCAVTGCENMSDEKHVPLASTVINAEGQFAGISNSTVIDVEFTQGDKPSVELICPQDYEKHVIIGVVGNTLEMKLTDKLDNAARNEVNRQLRHAKLYVTSSALDKVLVNGSSEFNVNGDLRAERLDVTLNGSGDVNFNGVHSNSHVTVTLNGSGDVLFRREAKAGNISLALNGSGDVNCAILTAEKVKAGVAGSGDIDIDEVAALELSLSVAGSGDLEAHRIMANNVQAVLTGSGDMKLSGTCDNAELNLTNSGNISAKNLEAMNVKSSVIGSGSIECHAQKELSASVTGSGDISYRGNPSIISSVKNGQLTKIR